MALTSRQAFKVAFLQKCADEGMTIEETADLVKYASASLEKLAGAVADIAKSVAPAGIGAGVGSLAGSPVLGGMVGAAGPTELTKYLLPKLIGAGLILPPAIGAVGGYLTAKLTGGNDESPDDIKTQEKVDAYRRATEATRESMAQTHRARPSHRRAFRGLI